MKNIRDDGTQGWKDGLAYVSTLSDETILNVKPIYSKKFMTKYINKTSTQKQKLIGYNINGRKVMRRGEGYESNYDKGHINAVIHGIWERRLKLAGELTPQHFTGDEAQ